MWNSAVVVLAVAVGANPFAHLAFHQGVDLRPLKRQRCSVVPVFVAQISSDMDV